MNHKPDVARAQARSNRRGGDKWRRARFRAHRDEDRRDAAARHRPHRAVRRQRGPSRVLVHARARPAHTAYSGLGRSARSLLLCRRGGRIRFVLTAGMHGGTELTRHVAEHGDGQGRRARGPRRGTGVPHRGSARRQGLLEPYEVSDEGGTVRLATIGTYGETYTFVERNGYRGAFMPGFEHVNGGATDAGLLSGRPRDRQRRGQLDSGVRLRRVRVHRDDPLLDRDIPPSTGPDVEGDGRRQGADLFPINERRGKRSPDRGHLEFYGGAASSAWRCRHGHRARIRAAPVACRFLATPEAT